MFERDVFYECSLHSGEEPANFEGILTTLPSSALQPAPLPSILKTIKSKKNTSRRVSLGVPVYYDYFSRYNNQDVEEYMKETSLNYRHTQHLAKKEMRRVQSEAVALAKSVIRFTGKQVLPAFLERLFDSCLDPATPQDLTAFIAASQELEEELKHAATTIQCAFRVPPTASSAKLSLWKRLHQEKIKTTATEEKIKSEEAPPVTVATKYRVFKPSIDSKKNRADRQTTLSSIRKNKKAANLAQRRGLAAVTSLPIIQAPVRALIPYAPSAPIKKKKKDSSVTTSELSQLTKFEHLLQEYMSIQFISILSECALTSIIEVDEPIELTSILPKCKLHPIKEVQEPVDLSVAATTIQALIRGALTRSTREDPKVGATTATDPEEIKVEATTSSDSTTTELGQILPVEQEPELEVTTTDLWDDEFSQPHSAEADDDIDFGHADEPLDIPEATPEPFQSPKKRRRCKAVESSLDGHYWSVSSTRRRRKSTRVRRQPDFFTPL